MPALDEYVSQLVRETYRQGWDDAIRHFDLAYKVADLKHMQGEQDRQVETILHRLREDLGMEKS